VSAAGTPSGERVSAAETPTAVEAPRAVLHAVHLYPATMNTYGDRGNVAALTRRAAWRGIPLHWHFVELG
jgi:hypothetical protein